MKKFLVILCLSLFPMVVQADQAAYVSKAEAVKAASVLRNSKEVRHYCQPCGDRRWEREEVKDVQAKHTGYQDFWEVQINGKGVDLAYIYFESNGQWKNVAITLGIKVFDVPALLPNP
jgi:hypothetical protein